MASSRSSCSPFGQIADLHGGAHGHRPAVHHVEQIGVEVREADEALYLALLSPDCSATMSRERALANLCPTGAQVKSERQYPCRLRASIFIL